MWNIKNTLDYVKQKIGSVNITTSSDKYQKFDLIYDILENEHIEPESISGDEMLESALRWYVEAIWDPYTVYLTPLDNESLNDGLKWSSDFEWIGAVVTKKKNWIMIEQLIKDWPAFKAWVQPLDIVIKVDWEDISMLPLGKAVSKIKWPSWTIVKLIIIRENNLLEIEVTRAKVHIASVMWDIKTLTWWIDIWYITISIIWEDTERALKSLIKEHKEKNIKWVILDLRWNWGWFLPIAVNIASFWLPKWKVVVSTKYRNYANFKRELSRWYGDLENMPTVILIDWLTASAAEIITAAVNKWTWAKTIGVKTFWKWSIQTLEDFTDNSSLKFTIWKWYTPDDTNVDKEWIIPDIEVPFDREKYKIDWYDSQLEKSKEVLLKDINK